MENLLFFGVPILKHIRVCGICFCYAKNNVENIVSWCSVFAFYFELLLFCLAIVSHKNYLWPGNPQTALSVVGCITIIIVHCDCKDYFFVWT